MPSLCHFERPFRLTSNSGARKINSTSTDSSASALVLNISIANVYHFGDATNRATPVFCNLSCMASGSGSMFDVGFSPGMLMGHLRIHPPPPPPAGLDPHDCVSMASFGNRRSAGGAFYDYTARYGAVREEDRITLRQSMFPETIDDLKPQTRIALESPSTDYKLFEYLVQKMGLAELLDLPRIALSDGQTRRARILKALLAEPQLLLLDEPLVKHLTGLDIENRATLHAACNPHIIIGLRMQDTIPDWIPISRAEMLRYKDELQRAVSALEKPVQSVAPTPSAGEPVVEMKGVSVTYWPRKILASFSVLKNINWTIRQGQRYHLQCRA
ncbi:hypothetical protein C8R47DRAFT_1152143 [Mycena vitilis]|nr:hypothetical protein C8R47DRAFT_1152143 [Mycena vitilis]